MPKYQARLVERFEVAEGTMAFGFEQPADFKFTAGQFITLILPNPLYDDAKGNRRTFSIASPPQETGRLLIATRMTGSALKRSLAELVLGTPVEIFGPSGFFTLHGDASVPAIFIAGGIGITPFRSMVHDAAARQLPHRITLVYSNRNLESTAFHDEFQQIAATPRNFNYIPTLTQADKSPRRWEGEQRYVNADFLRNHVDDLANPIVYLAGPPGLVAGVTKAVLEAGADPSRIHSEEFEGY
ncbi:MAG: ferredoxin--NADP reductase [bacterium]